MAPFLNNTGQLGGVSFQARQVLLHIGADALSRVRGSTKKLQSAARISLSHSAWTILLDALPTASGEYAPTATTPPGPLFTPVASASLSPEQQQTLKNDIGGEIGSLSVFWWSQRAQAIRSGGNDLECLGNLSLALTDLSNLLAAEYSGASGALSLLPTAGALIGAPSKELWVVFKLMPLAGVLSMLLSLGGTIVPSSASDYDPKSSFTYGGMVATEWVQEKQNRIDLEEQHPMMRLTDHERFADRVQRRSNDSSGGNSFTKIWIAVVIQVALLAVIFIALWYGQDGGVIVWWCRVWGWMYFWYMLVIITSFMENWASSPFSDSWTMRVSKAPRAIRISEDAPVVQASHDRDVLDSLNRGYNVEGRVIIDTEPHMKDRSCFYVVVSKEGVKPFHAVMRIVAKSSSIAVFAFGTALFASAQLMSISIVLMVLSLVISAAFFGRVTGMFIAAEMNRCNEPILHAVVRKHEDAAAHVEAVLGIPGLVVELKGHVIINGKAVARQTQWLSMSNYIGLLAKPFDVMDIAITVESAPSHTSALNSLLRSQSDIIEGETGKGRPGFGGFVRSEEVQNNGGESST